MNLKIPAVLTLKYEIKITYGDALKVNSSLVFRGFENLRDRPKNKDTSPGPFSGLGRQNCFTVRHRSSSLNA
jgi:hypothetical protein